MVDTLRLSAESKKFKLVHRRPYNFKKGGSHIKVPKCCHTSVSLIYCYFAYSTMVCGFVDVHLQCHSIAINNYCDLHISILVN